MSFIEAKNLSETYYDVGNETPALKDATFQIESGEFLTIMGPSGSGKSTLLHILGFLDNHTGGEYWFDGKKVSDYSKEDAAHVRNKKLGFIFQSFNLLPNISVLENVKLPLLYSGVKEELWGEMAMEAIKEVGMEHRANYESTRLSGGEKQRAAIARALVNNPQVIFADEPTGNLDSKSGKMVMQTLQKLNEEAGHTIILITHETYTAEHAQRIIRLRDGIIESDEKVAARHFAKQEFIK